MIYRRHGPAAPLDRFVEHFWFFESTSISHSRERVLPDGSSELIIDLGSVPRRWFDSYDPRRGTAFRRAWLSGAHAEFLLIEVLPVACLIGVHFRPGGLGAFLPFPAEEMTGRVEQAEGVWGNGITGLREVLQNTPSIPERFRLLEDFLRARLQPRAARAGMVERAIGSLMTAPEVENVAVLADRTGISQKHFIELFRQRVGLTPKKFARVQRFQKALVHIERMREVDWSALAYATGYFDQSHMIRDFQSFCGLRPTAYLSARNEWLNFVPEPPVPTS